MQRAQEDHEGIVELVKDTADGLVQLVADHLKLARIEMMSDVRGYARDVGGLLVGGFVLAVGYLLLWVAIAFALSRVVAPMFAFGAVAVLHLIVGAVAVVVLARRIRATRPMHESTIEAKRSVSALSPAAPARNQ